MWEEFALTLIPSNLEAIGTKLISNKNKIKMQNELSTIVGKQFDSFADSSLDSDTFFLLIKSTHFVEIIRNYFFMVNDRSSIEEYKTNIKKLIYNECKTAKLTDIEAFLNKLKELYTEYLHKIIEENPEINAFFQLMSISHREIISRIQDNESELKRYLDTLVNRKASISDENIKLYHSVAERELGEIRFTGIAGAERRKAQELNEFYVENTFSYFAKEIDRGYEYSFEEIESIKLKNFFDLGNKIILIGGAGLGKTTTLNYLFCNYEKLYSATALKLKLDLKQYAEEIGLKKKGILWCIATEFIRKIKYSGETIEEIQAIIADKLNSGSCLVILDALDEIPTQALRNTVRTEIENFTSVYYLNRFIISTREAGYLKNRFDKTFLHIRINKFNPTQIKKYSQNWYLSYYESTALFDEFWSKFDNEVKRARCKNLISNPIILILALVIFDYESSLPTRRIEFYQKCIDTFLTERESRKAAINLNSKTRSILSTNLTVPKIAYYRYKKLEQNSGYKFKYSELEQAIKEAIAVEDELNWSEAVKQYSEYLVERTELIQEIDEDNLDFAHKTFYEYFLAFYFSKTSNNQDLGNLLNKWIGDPNYDELARLIVEVVIQNNDPKQHDYIINHMFEILTDNASGEDIPNKYDVFEVISDLYTHNLLHPQYQYKYNRYILYNSRIIDIVNFRLHHIENRKDLLLYDSQIISKLFMEAFRNDKLVDVIDALYFLNNEFKNAVILDDTSKLLYRINKLFTIFKKAKEKEIAPDEKNIVEYFVNEGIDYSLRYPQIFISVLSLAIEKEYNISIEKLLEYKFEPRNVFFYISPPSLFFLLEKAMESKIYFALLFTAMIQCAFKASNTIFRFVIRSFITIREKDDCEPKICPFYIRLWQVLNKSDSLDALKTFLIEFNLYDEKYDSLYQKLYLCYLETEKGINDKQIPSLIKEYEKTICRDSI